eukprot:CAMPEP_0194238768 /NCGR_PEP_ID=MMETSP0158-20130606/5430_1 /TAXON_ID=33649 /ORGANISM="Thalassionema nitzschioides, Strain L26-B" /LENGTH=158 /DNA_ID=CAMNT_0038973095 /DNA_START=16 /DNA_END=492 /DNA_ORIENTATION=-
MKIIAASLITATAAFAPQPSILVAKTTALHGQNPFGGWTPGAAAAPSTPVGGGGGTANPFGGWTPGAPAAAPAAEEFTSSVPWIETAPPAAAAGGQIFSGFGHATEPLGPNNSPFRAAGGAKPAAAAAAPPKPDGPIFSGFGHATDPLGPNNSPFKKA